jgi:hypothetical protein
MRQILIFKLAGSAPGQDLFLGRRALSAGCLHRQPAANIGYAQPSFDAISLQHRIQVTGIEAVSRSGRIHNLFNWYSRRIEPLPATVRQGSPTAELDNYLRRQFCQPINALSTLFPRQPQASLHSVTSWTQAISVIIQRSVD